MVTRRVKSKELYEEAYKMNLKEVQTIAADFKSVLGKREKDLDDDSEDLDNDGVEELKDQ